jgi:hypothetical protein
VAGAAVIVVALLISQGNLLTAPFGAPAAPPI